MSDKLKPCPFCGGNADIEDISESEDMNAIWMIVCNKCGGSYRDWETDRKSTRLNSSHSGESRMPSAA